MSFKSALVTNDGAFLSMAGYARIQRWCLYVGLIALAVMFILMSEERCS